MPHYIIFYGMITHKRECHQTHNNYIPHSYLQSNLIFSFFLSTFIYSSIYFYISSFISHSLSLLLPPSLLVSFFASLLLCLLLHSLHSFLSILSMPISSSLGWIRRPGTILRRCGGTSKWRGYDWFHYLTFSSDIYFSFYIKLLIHSQFIFSCCVHFLFDFWFLILFFDFLIFLYFLYIHYVFRCYGIWLRYYGL